MDAEVDELDAPGEQHQHDKTGQDDAMQAFFRWGPFCPQYHALLL